MKLFDQSSGNPQDHRKTANYAPWMLRTRTLLVRLIGLALLWICVMPRVVGGLNTFTVVSGISMEPTFHTGDLIISRGAKEYQVGDVVTYKIPDDKYRKFRIVHRVIGRTKDGGYEIQGDNQDHADPWSIPAANIVGRKVFMIPKGGFVLGYARNPIGLALLFGALVTWTFWPKRNEEETQNNPLLAPCDLSALLCRDSSDDHEPLVVGTSLTYAQFLNRPTLRAVVQAQATGLPKISAFPNFADAISETKSVAISETVPKPVPEVLPVTGRGMAEGKVQGMEQTPFSGFPTHAAIAPPTYEGAPPVDLKTFSVETIESPQSGALFGNVQSEEHLADWASQSARSTQFAELVTEPTDAVLEFTNTSTNTSTSAIATPVERECDSHAIDDGPNPNFAEAWGFDEDNADDFCEPATTELTASTSQQLTRLTSSDQPPEFRWDVAMPVTETIRSTTRQQPTVDELLERWINDEADAPLPDELFVTV
jgi:signal peptidase I